MFVGFGQGVFGFVGGGFHQAGHGLEGLGSVEDEFRKVENVGAPDLGFLVVEEVAGRPMWFPEAMAARRASASVALSVRVRMATMSSMLGWGM